MERDLRETPLFREMEESARRWLQPGTGLIRDASEYAVAANGRTIAFTGTVFERLVGAPATRVCVLDAESCEMRIVTFGPGSDRLPRWSADGRTLYFLSDRDAPGRFHPYALDLSSGAARALPRPPGWVEYLQVSPDGRRLLLGVAGLGADLAGAHGGLQSAQPASVLPEWMPEVETGDESFRWRSVWVLALVGGDLRRATPSGMNPWEACWCGNDALAVVASERPDEAAWYSATLRRIDLASDAIVELYASRVQLGLPCAAPSGEAVAIVESVCSDRAVVAGDLLVIRRGGGVQRIDTHDVDVTCCVWAEEHVLAYSGLRGLDTVVGRSELGGATEQLWAGSEITIGSRIYPDFAVVPRSGGRAFVTSRQGFVQPPSLARFEDVWRELRSFASPEPELLPEGTNARGFRWTAPDGLEIEGWLVRADELPSRPLVVDIHGGPVWAFRPRYLGAGGYALALLRRGYALLLPNPRGSSGRGQSYARRVFGDMGGADTQDVLSGVDELVRGGVADPRRLGVMGGSYGGYMSSWLVTQDTRFAAAVPFSPVTNWVSEHLTCHIPHFCEQFLADDMRNFGGRYYTRSPVMYADRVRTPVLNVCGALDRNTPPGQAMEFHRALQRHGVASVLVTYPREGHGVRTYPAAFDFSARVVDWFERHLSQRSERR